jgi:hypothetical protein
LPAKDEQADSIAFLVLANTTPTDREVPGQQREDDLGRLTRSVPLYLADPVFFWTGKKPSLALPVVVGHGPVVAGKEWSEEQVFQFVDGTAAQIVSGCVEEANGHLKFTLTVWDGATKKALRSFQRSASRDAYGEAVLALERDVLSLVDPTYTKSTIPAASFYVRPNQAQVPHYLASLAQTLMMTLVHNEHVPKDGLWGERNMFEWYLGTALEMEGAQVPRILFLASLNKSRGYGSDVFREYERQAVKLLKDENNRGSGFYRLSPLLFKLFGMDDEFEKRKSELLVSADAAYKTWLDGLADTE